MDLDWEAGTYTPPTMFADVLAFYKDQGRTCHYVILLHVPRTVHQTKTTKVRQIFGTIEVLKRQYSPNVR